MQKSIIATLLVFYTLPTFAAQVLKVGSGGKTIAISHESDRKWSVGDEVCVTHRNTLEGCGTVTKVRGSGAIVSMDSGSNRITKGDLAEAKSSSESGSDSVSISSHSTNTSPSSFALGFHGGAAFATIGVNPATTTTYTTRTGIVFGATANLRIASWFYLQPELIYVQKGLKTSTTLTTVNDKYGYLEIPILMEFKFRAGRWMPYFQTGPFVGFNMSGTRTTTVTSTGTATDTDIKNDIKSTEFGAYFGAGVDFLVGHKTSINLTTRYSLGLSNIDNTTSATTTGATTKTRNFQGLIGMRFWF